MPASPKRSGKKARGESRFPSEVLAANLVRERQLQQLTQEEIAERMRLLGHEWVRATVSEVERLGRLVSVEELGGLALVFSTTIPRLLSPPVFEDDPPSVDHGGPEPISRWLEFLWLHDLVTFVWEWDEGLPPKPMLGVRLTESGHFSKGEDVPAKAAELLRSLQDGDRQLREHRKRLEETFASMGMEPTAAKAAARGRKQPALYYLMSSDVEDRTINYLIWRDDLKTRPFVDPPGEEGDSEDEGAVYPCAESTPHSTGPCEMPSAGAISPGTRSTTPIRLAPWTVSCSLPKPGRSRI
jgi:transcriptional regulator with XRE-family HTH domain